MPLQKCPRCGFSLQPPKGKKVMERIWMSVELQKEWTELSKNHKTKELAFYELVRKAELYDKLQEGRTRVAVEVGDKTAT